MQNGTGVTSQGMFRLGSLILSCFIFRVLYTEFHKYKWLFNYKLVIQLIHLLTSRSYLQLIINVVYSHRLQRYCCLLQMSETPKMCEISVVIVGVCIDAIVT